MKASSKHSALRAALLALPALMLAACSSTPSRDTTPAKKPPVTAPSKPATPAPDKGDPQGRFDAALEVMKSGDLVEAEQQFGALTKDFPNFAGPWTNLGIIYAKTKRRDAAVNAFSRAAVLNPQNNVAFNWLGMLNREAGSYDRARIAYEKALQIDPQDQLARLNYAILLDQYLKQPQAALEQYKLYQANAGKEDLRVLAWSAAIEAQLKAAAAAAPAPAPVVATPEKKQ